MDACRIRIRHGLRWNDNRRLSHDPHGTPPNDITWGLQEQERQDDPVALERVAFNLHHPSVRAKRGTPVSGAAGLPRFARNDDSHFLQAALPQPLAKKRRRSLIRQRRARFIAPCTHFCSKAVIEPRIVVQYDLGVIV